MSYNGRVFFGLCGDDSFGPELDVVAAGIESALAELAAEHPILSVR